MEIISIGIIGGYVLLNQKLKNIFIGKTIGKNKFEKGEETRKEYTKEMLAFFKAKGRDKFKHAEKGLILQREYGFKNWKDVLLLGLYYYFIFLGFKNLFKNKTLLFLPILGPFGWVKTLFFMIFLKYILTKIYKRIKNVQRKQNVSKNTKKQ